MKRLSIIITYVFLSLAAVAASFTLMALTSSSAYAHSHMRGGDNRDVNETRPAKADGEVRIDNLAGSVKVQAWDKNEVRVTGELSEDVKRLDITSDASGIEIRVILPHERDDSAAREAEGDDNDDEDDNDDDDENNAYADLTVQVPAGSHLEVSTVSADVETQGLNGFQQVGTVSGSVSIASTGSHVEAKSVSGDVTLQGSAKGARITANSVSGTVHINNIDGTLYAESVSGDVKVGGSHLSSIQMSSTSGSLTFSGSLQKGGDYDFNNVSGDIDVGVGQSPNARFDLSSFSGDIDNSFGPKPTRVSKYSPGMELHFTNGSADAQVNARTLSGDLHLHN